MPKWLSAQTISVILTHEVRWQAEIPKRFSVQTISVDPDTGSQVADGGTLWLSAPFVNQSEWVRWYQDDVGRLILIIFKIFAGFYSRHPKTFKPDVA